MRTHIISKKFLTFEFPWRELKRRGNPVGIGIKEILSTKKMALKISLMPIRLIKYLKITGLNFSGNNQASYAAWQNNTLVPVKIQTVSNMMLRSSIIQYFFLLHFVSQKITYYSIVLHADIKF